MRKVIAALIVLSCAIPVSAQVHVKGYVKKDGTYVAPHVRSAPNNSALDNWSTKPNVNPYTGKQGSVDPYAPPKPTYSNPYSSPPRTSGYTPYTPPKAPCYGYCPK